MEPLSLIDLLDEAHLPLKNRVDACGFYAPQPEALIPTESLAPGEQYRFHFDMGRCVGCQCCVVACNEQNNNPPDVNWRRVGEIEGGVYPHTQRYHLSMGCNHCLDPACLTGCPTGAYVKNETNGLVLQQAEECIGCQYCTWNCPYGVPQFNPERNIVTKCDMCHGRLDRGEAPACVSACPETAIRIEKVSGAEWRANPAQANAPHVPDSGITISTTRITLPDDVPPEMLRANRHRVEPEKPHYSLIFMTVLTQLAAGGFLTLWLGTLASRALASLSPFEKFLPFGACGMLVVTGLALSASLFHLGRPIYAYKALRMWKRSWLSREVLLFSLFSIAGGVYAALLLATHFLGLRSPTWLSMSLGGGVALLGAGGIFASARIYMVPARPAWNSVRTPLRFFLTGLILGPLFALLVYALYVALHGSRAEADSLMGPVRWLLTVSSGAALGQLLVLVIRLIDLREGSEPELYGSTVLLTRRFRAHFLARIGLLVVGNLGLPLWLTGWLASSGTTSPRLVGFACGAFLLSFAGELLGRYLFYVTVVPKNIPGSFFTQNGGAH